MAVEPEAERPENLSELVEAVDQTPGTDELSTAATTAAVAPSAGPDLNDMDAALAWLEGLAAKQGADEDSLKISAPEDRTEAPPDWVTSLAPSAAEGTEEATLEESQPTLESETAPAGTEEIPDWLRSVKSISPEVESEVSPGEEPAAEALPAEELPDWLKEPALKDSDADADQLPEWLTAEPAIPIEISDETAAATVHAEPVETTGTPPSDIDAAMAWLEGLALKQGADEETLKISNQEDRSEIAPAWISEFTPVANAAPADEVVSEEKTQPIKIKPVAESEVSLPAELEPEIIAQELPGADAEPIEELPAWLAGLEEELPPQAVVILPSPETMVSDAISEKPAMTEAVEEVEEIVAAEATEAAETKWLNEVPSQEPPTQVSEPAVVEPAGVDLNDMDAAMAWLEALALKQGAEEDTLKITAPETRSDTPPEWIAALAEQDRPAEPMEVPPPEHVAELPDRQPADEPAMVVPIQPAVPAEEAQAAAEPAGEADIPDWLLNYEEEQQLKTQTWQAPAEAAGSGFCPILRRG